VYSTAGLDSFCFVPVMALYILLQLHPSALISSALFLGTWQVQFSGVIQCTS